MLDHWSGHRGSAPVRFGDDASDQLQLDIYGELIDSIYLFNSYGSGISLDDWRELQRVVAWLQDDWDRPDEGIWEVRSGRRAHTFSRLMCWVALERMIRMARQRGLPGDISSWERSRDAVFADLEEHGWDADQGAYVRARGESVLDSSLLLMPMVKYLAPTDPRFSSTLRAVEASLVTESPVFRYDPRASPDGLKGEEGTSSMCSFCQLPRAVRGAGGPDRRAARQLPRAFTHLSLISAAIDLDRALG